MVHRPTPLVVDLIKNAESLTLPLEVLNQYSGKYHPGICIFNHWYAHSTLTPAASGESLRAVAMPVLGTLSGNSIIRSGPVSLLDSSAFINVFFVFEVVTTSFGPWICFLDIYRSNMLCLRWWASHPRAQQAVASHAEGINMCEWDWTVVSRSQTLVLNSDCQEILVLVVGWPVVPVFPGLRGFPRQRTFSFKTSKVPGKLVLVTLHGDTTTL